MVTVGRVKFNFKKSRIDALLHRAFGHLCRAPRTFCRHSDCTLRVKHPNPELEHFLIPFHMYDIVVIPDFVFNSVFTTS